MIYFLFGCVVFCISACMYLMLSMDYMLSQEFLIERGYCCGHGCLMCPYEPKHTKDNKVLGVSIMKVSIEYCMQ